MQEKEREVKAWECRWSAVIAGKIVEKHLYGRGTPAERRKREETVAQ